MGCLLSKDDSVEDGGARPAAPKGRDRKKSSIALDFSKAVKEELPPPDKAKPSTEKAENCEKLILQTLSKKKLPVHSIPGFRQPGTGELFLENLELLNEDDSEEDSDNSEEEEAKSPAVKANWEDFGRIETVTKVASIKLGYSDFNELGECKNFVNCRMLSFAGCDNLHEESVSEPAFPKLLQELDVQESSFEAWDAVDRDCKHLTTLIASGMEKLPTKLPETLESIDLGCTSSEEKPWSWKLLSDLPKLKKLDLKGIECSIKGECKLNKNIKYINVEMTDFDDVDFLKALGSDCEIMCNDELKAKLEQ